MNRRSMIVLLIGIISAITGAGTATLVERRRCVGRGGQWDAAGRQCEYATGVSSGLSAVSIASGILVGVFLAVMLYRAVLFFALRRKPNSNATKTNVR